MFENKTLLIGIGAQKAGTTWLSRYLAGHPQVFMAPMKEMHYFDRKYPVDALANRERLLEPSADREGVDQIENEDGYIDFFRKRVGGQTVFSEFTPRYAVLDAKAFAIMSRVHPDVRFLFIMRDPVDRSWSQFCFARRFRTGPFAKEDFVRALGNPPMGLRSDYKRTIEELEKAVKPERTKLIFYEDMFNDAGVRQVTEFVGVDPWPADFEQKVASRKPELDPDMARAAFERFRHVYDYMAARFAGRLPGRWVDTMKRYGR